MSSHQQPTYVDSKVLKALLEDKSKIPGKDYLVIDVRDTDFVVREYFFFKALWSPPSPRFGLAPFPLSPILTYTSQQERGESIDLCLARSALFSNPANCFS